MKQKNGGQLHILACFGGRIGSRFRQNLAELARIEKKGESARQTLDAASGRIRCGCGNRGATPVLSWLFVCACYLIPLVVIDLSLGVLVCTTQINFNVDLFGAISISLSYR